ncbi:MAG TPA: hypothetical protein EYQ18_02220 [Candidatus Handelsmanbacteria bacterium]|nr:hypothetical protein [Candidatus Handelsmanbacteria bacterium]
MGYIDIEAFFRQGYAIIPVLDERKAARYAANAYVGDGAKTDLLLIPELPTVLEHPVVQGAIAQILGGSDLRLETWKLMAVEVGEDYRQGKAFVEDLDAQIIDRYKDSL